MHARKKDNAISCCHQEYYVFPFQIYADFYRKAPLRYSGLAE